MNSRITYSAITERAPIAWPSNARIALWVAPNIEHYEYLPSLVKVRDPWPRTPHPDILGYGQRDYGNRVGVWRFFEELVKQVKELREKKKEALKDIDQDHENL